MGFQLLNVFYPSGYCLKYQKHKLGNSNTVELRRIAAHADLWGNEQADELAKLCTTSDSILECPIPHTNIKNKIDEKFSKLNLEDWTDNTPTTLQDAFW